MIAAPAPRPITGLPTVPPSVLPLIPPEVIADARAKGEQWFVRASPACIADVARRDPLRSLDPHTKETAVMVFGHQIKRLENNEAALREAENRGDANKRQEALAILRYVYQDVERSFPNCGLFGRKKLQIEP